jgi:hypothetical protein
MSNKTARSTDTPSSTTAPTKTPRRTRVTHLYWVQQARLAQAVGLPTAYLCGRWAKRRTSPDTDPRLEVIGGLMLVSRPRDCRQCVRAYEKALQEQEH